MPGNPSAQNRSQSSPQGIGNDVSHAGISGWKKCLQGFDGKTHGESQSNRTSHRCPLALSRRRKIRTEEESERNKSSYIDSDVFPVPPTSVKLAPRAFEQLFIQDEEAVRNNEVGRCICLVMDDAPVPLIEHVERSRVIGLRQSRVTIPCCSSVVLRNFAGRKFPAVDRKPPEPPGPVMGARWGVANYQLPG